MQKLTLNRTIRMFPNAEGLSFSTIVKAEKNSNVQQVNMSLEYNEKTIANVHMGVNLIFVYAGGRKLTIEIKSGKVVSEEAYEL